MRFLKYLVALWVAVTFYAVTSVFIGDIGFVAYRELARERDKQKLNIETLSEKNRELEGLQDALLYDSDTIAVYARDLGFGREDEAFIRIVGFGERVKQPAAVGELTPVIKRKHTPDRVLRLIASCTGLGIIILLGILDWKRISSFLHRRP
jgi:cell division protein FtsB